MTEAYHISQVFQQCGIISSMSTILLALVFRWQRSRRDANPLQLHVQYTPLASYKIFVQKRHASNKDLERSAPLRAEKQDGENENLIIGDRDADAYVGPKTDQKFINPKEDIHVVVQGDDDSFDISWNDM